MVDKIFWQRLIPIMLHIPILKQLAMCLLTKQLAGIVVDSVKNYYKSLEIRDNGELKDNPLWVIACSLSALYALMPVAVIYGCFNSMVEKAKQK